MSSPISQRVIARPDFTRADAEFPEWLEENLDALTAYYAATVDGGPLAFESFALTQYDCQKSQDEDDDHYFASGEWAREEASEPYDGWEE